MPENITAENLLNNIMETLAEGVLQHKTTSSMEEEISKSVTSRFNRQFGRQKAVHTLLGGGKCNIFLVSFLFFSIPLFGFGSVLFVCCLLGCNHL